MRYPTHRHRPPQCRATLSNGDHLDRAIDPPEPEVVYPAPVRLNGTGQATFRPPVVAILTVIHRAAAR